MTHTSNKGILFALTAALLNSSIAIISKSLLPELAPALIALYKSALGALLLWIFVRQKTPLKLPVVLACAFLGIFCLFFFETSAYQHEKASNVVFAMMASATVTAFACDLITKRETASLGKSLGLLLCLGGMALLLNIEKPASMIGVLLAALAGVGYGAFSVVAKAKKLGSGLVVTRALLTAGAVYLIVPAAVTGFKIPTWHALALLLALAALPSILGFYCTTKAVELTTPTRVQICELCEPIFVLALSFLILGELPAEKNLLGSAIILFGIACANFDIFKKEKSVALAS
ncbi:DMT family transporter [Chromobacterium sp. ASV23]|uniref:DMT family transporter n=1 Tax=Chromobacterium sp. ASV23 TaxID=2795110 RepID=UPI0018ED95AF|nr:DMT family transporter [Chromobacterium sp. ASV23]